MPNFIKIGETTLEKALIFFTLFNFWLPWGTSWAKGQRFGWYTNPAEFVYIVMTTSIRDICCQTSSIFCCRHNPQKTYSKRYVSALHAVTKNIKIKKNISIALSAIIKVCQAD